MTSKDPLITILQGRTDFNDLDLSLLETLVKNAFLRRFDPGQFVFLEGSSDTGYQIVESGWLKASKISAAGREQILHFLGPGKSFNLTAVISGKANQVTVEALEPSKVWVIPRDDLLDTMAESPILARILTEQLASQNTYLINLIHTLALQTVEARLAGIFLEHSSGEIMKRRPWSTQAKMAARLGTVPDVLNRALNKLADEGLIKIDRHQIQILNREGLERKALQQD